MKKIVVLLLVLTLAVMTALLVSCQGGTNVTDDSTTAEKVTTGAPGTGSATTETPGTGSTTTEAPGTGTNAPATTEEPTTEAAPVEYSHNYTPDKA